MRRTHFYIFVYIVIFFISCNNTADSKKTSIEDKARQNQLKKEKIIQGLISKYDAIHLNSFSGKSYGLSTFTYEVQQLINANKDKVFLVEGTLADIIMHGNRYSMHLEGYMDILRYFRLISYLTENQFEVIQRNIELNSYNSYAVVVKINHLKYTLYDVEANESSEVTYDVPGFLFLYSDLLEIKKLH